MKNNKKQTKLLSSQEAADKLNISLSTIYRMVRDNRLSKKSYRGTMGFDLNDIKNLIKNNKTNPYLKPRGGFKSRKTSDLPRQVRFIPYAAIGFAVILFGCIYILAK